MAIGNLKSGFDFAAIIGQDTLRVTLLRPFVEARLAVAAATVLSVRANVELF